MSLYARKPLPMYTIIEFTQPPSTIWTFVALARKIGKNWFWRLTCSFEFDYRFSKVKMAKFMINHCDHSGVDRKFQFQSGKKTMVFAVTLVCYLKMISGDILAWYSWLCIATAFRPFSKWKSEPNIESKVHSPLLRDTSPPLKLSNWYHSAQPQWTTASSIGLCLMIVDPEWQ